MNVRLYVEGGGEGKQSQIECRGGFRKLLEKADFAGRMPRIVASGTRRNAYDDFKTAVTDGSGFAILLVDSEDPVTAPPWDHLYQRDGWQRPAGVADDQAQLMVTCMETWLMADRTALRAVFRDCLQESALLPIADLETRARQDVQDQLKHATRDCGRNKAYTKGKRSFEILAMVEPAQLQSLPHFRRFVDTLMRYR